MTLGIGIASWQNPEMLRKAIQGIQEHTDGDWKLLIVDNCSPDPLVRRYIEDAAAGDPRIIPEFGTENIGYVGAVNRILEWGAAEGFQRVAYCDNDAILHQQGWNTQMEHVLDRHHEVCMVFPEKFCAYPLQRTGFKEVLWGLGCFWMLAVARYKEIGPWDTNLGHQEEVDYCTRLRLAGWKLAGVPLNVMHEGKATNSPEAQERINKGVIAWVDKWAAYFGGKQVNYFSPNVIRFEDWNINALYLEEWYQSKQQEGRLPKLNENPRQVVLEGKTYDVIEVLRYPHLYRDRLV